MGSAFGKNPNPARVDQLGQLLHRHNTSVADQMPNMSQGDTVTLYTFNDGAYELRCLVPSGTEVPREIVKLAKSLGFHRPTKWKSETIHLTVLDGPYGKCVCADTASLRRDRPVFKTLTNLLAARGLQLIFDRSELLSEGQDGAIHQVDHQKESGGGTREESTEETQESDETPPDDASIRSALLAANIAALRSCTTPGRMHWVVWEDKLRLTHPGSADLGADEPGGLAYFDGRSVRFFGASGSAAAVIRYYMSNSLKDYAFEFPEDTDWSSWSEKESSEDPDESSRSESESSDEPSDGIELTPTTWGLTAAGLHLGDEYHANELAKGTCWTDLSSVIEFDGVPAELAEAAVIAARLRFGDEIEVRFR